MSAGCWDRREKGREQSQEGSEAVGSECGVGAASVEKWKMENVPIFIIFGVPILGSGWVPCWCFAFFAFIYMLTKTNSGWKPTTAAKDKRTVPLFPETKNAFVHDAFSA